MIGPLLRTRRNKPVFTFWNVIMGPAAFPIHCWLAKPLPPLPGGSSVTFWPELVDLLVSASPRFSRTTESLEPLKQSVHAVEPFCLGFRIASAPEKVLFGVPRK